MRRLRIGISIFLLIFSGLLTISCSDRIAENSSETMGTDYTSQLSAASDPSTQSEQSIALPSAPETDHSAGIISNPEFEHSFGFDESFDGPQHPADSVPPVGEQQALFSRLMSHFIQSWNSGGIEFTNKGDQDGAISIMFGYYEDPDDEMPVFTNIMTAAIPAGESYTFIDEYQSVYGEWLTSKIVAVRYGDEYAEYDDSFIVW